MSYYLVNTAVRWSNGELEGFSATGLTEQSARERALNQAAIKAQSLGVATPKALTPKEYAALEDDEQDMIQSDWQSNRIQGGL